MTAGATLLSARRFACAVVCLCIGALLAPATAQATPGDDDAVAADADVPLSWAIDAPVLGVGATGPEVRAWQIAMNNWLDVVAPDEEFRLVVDGDYGLLTDSVTRRFQFAQHLPIDGLVGPVTRAAYLSAPELVEASATPVAHAPFLAPGDRGDDVARWQMDLTRWLTATGAWSPPLGIDGIYGPETEAATRLFQTAQGVTADGLAGPETRAALASAPALVNVSPVTTPAPAPPAPPTPALPASGICAVDQAPIVEVVLGPDVAMPRCVVMSGDHRLRIVNSGAATHVELGTLELDLDAGATATSPSPVGAYADVGITSVAVERYGETGPEIQIR